MHPQQNKLNNKKILIMTYYLVTNENNVTFPQKTIEINQSYTEQNPNYVFQLYKDLHTAKFIQPTLEGIQNPKFWLVKAHGIRKRNILRDSFSSCSIIKEEDPTLPTDEQYFNFAAIMCANYVVNKVFTQWLLDYLEGKDKSPDTANAMIEKMRLQSYMDIPLEESYLAPTYALFNSIITQDFKKHCSISAYKMISDAPPNLQVEKFALAAVKNNTEQIYKMIKDSI